VRTARVWQELLGLVHTVVEGVELDDTTGVVVVSVRPAKRAQRRCGRCGRRASWYDRGERRSGARRRWRALDVGERRCYLQADAPRVNCPAHGPTVIQTPWARHGAGHTRAFDDTVAWLVVRCSRSAVSELLRIAWRTVGSIISRVQADIDRAVDRFEGLARIGIDEISYKRGHKYLTVVVDHDTGRLVWAAAGRDEATLESFFDALGADRCAKITHVSADNADWIARVVARRCPQAVRCADPFHVVKWATDALDEVRRQAWNEARGGPNRSNSDRRHKHPTVHPLKKVRWALWKNPQDLTDRQHEHLAWLVKTHPRVHRAYLLKEGLRLVFQLKGQAAKDTLDHWISWARRCRIATFVRLQRRIVKHRNAIYATLDSGLSNGLIESTNTKIRLLTRIAFGFRSANALIALTLLALGGHQPNLPGRQTTHGTSR
jgi:transposase